MPNTVLIGAQWGDEGKGKVIDVLTDEVDIVVRYQGGSNAGHTVEIEDKKYVLHLIPSGILRPGKVCVIGNGVVVDPVALVEEAKGLAEKGIELGQRFFVSDRAHVVFPYHRELDISRESRSDKTQRIGTTKRGIGPCYGDKMSRRGLRVGDMLDTEVFRDLLAHRVEEQNRILKALQADTLDFPKVLARYEDAARYLRPYVTDTVTLLNQACKKGQSILFEGAQGTLLDIDFGTYPFVTSSNSSAGGACTGSGVPPHRMDRVIGVIKAYTTRVGEGPFPTELTEGVGKILSKEGNEFGATTGRPRRCGWFDAVVARYAAMINGVDFWAITKLDVLDTVETLRICVAYECDGRKVDAFPANIRSLSRCTPVYEDMPGWLCSTRDVTRFQDLPPRARAYVERLCEVTDVPLGILSVGPRRAGTMRIGI